MKIDLSELPQLDIIFEELRRGRHLCEEDRTSYYLLKEQFESYKQLFMALGFELCFHDRGFFYFQGRGELAKEATQMAVFFFVFVDALGDEGVNINQAIFEHEYRVEELPHFQRESHRQCMAEVEVHDVDGLRKVVGRLERHGFVRSGKDGWFRFRRPAWRFIDLCMEAAQSDEVMNDELDKDE